MGFFHDTDRERYFSRLLFAALGIIAGFWNMLQSFGGQNGATIHDVVVT
jgi:hypothetical protein